MSTPLIGVVVPAHDEEELLADCLAGLRDAARAVADRARVCVVVVADDCSDGTEALARRHRVGDLRVAAHNVGRARAAGAELLLSGPATWLATTDADSVVPPDWLAGQLDARDAGADAWVGTVELADGSGLPAPVRARHRAAYADRAAGDRHRHVHGASLGVAARAYRGVGGFPPLASGEDVALVRRLDEAGLRAVRDPAHPVATSARTAARAPDGFASHLLRLAERHVIPAGPGTSPCEGGSAARIS